MMNLLILLPCAGKSASGNSVKGLLQIVGSRNFLLTAKHLLWKIFKNSLNLNSGANVPK